MSLLRSSNISNVIFLLMCHPTNMSPLCGSRTIMRESTKMLPLYDHMNIIIEMHIYKKAPAGRHISRKIHTKKNKRATEWRNKNSLLKNHFLSCHMSLLWSSNIFRIIYLLICHRSAVQGQLNAC